MEITSIKCENSKKFVVTDNERPRFSFAVSSDIRGEKVKSATISLNGWNATAEAGKVIEYGGARLTPFTRYTAKVFVEGSSGACAEAEITFATGRLYIPWQAKWITDGRYVFKAKKVSPVPMSFCKEFRIKKRVKKALILSTALGIYKIELNGKKLGDRYFAPGFTSYKSNLQYQTYDVTDSLSENNTVTATVAGGWAVGSFVFTRKNRITAKRQAFLAEIRIWYEDGEQEIIATGVGWKTTEDGCFRMADFYDGETFDATRDLSSAHWRNVIRENVKIRPTISAEHGAPVVKKDTLKPRTVTTLKSGEIVYDFGVNFAGVIHAKIKGEKGRQIVFRHAEILKDDGSLNCELLRSAKATVTYICKDGVQEYSPEFTYMGFRYVGVSGIVCDDLELEAFVLSSDIEETGSFTCSDERINKLQENIVRSARSNFMDIPTDCPQRDERMGWTGDIAVFAKTACYNFDMSRFFEKWLKDLKFEQRKTGGIPNVIPQHGYGFPATMPVMAIDFWGDACVLVPWAEYLARGDIKILETYYPVMKKYVNACRFWARFLSVGKKRYIWHTPYTFHFGDWIAPDVSKMSDWQKRSKYTATASLKNTSGLLSEIASLLGKDEDAKYYAKLSAKVAEAYISVFTDGNGKLKNEFQTGYVLPLVFKMFDEKTAKKAAENLAELLKSNGYRIGTGFPGTPYILFALSDNGQKETAFKTLLNTSCPSWLYEVKAGATSIWERWDALKENGENNFGSSDGTGGMVSFNHYASGAVGDFLYRRILGIEPLACGYKKFEIKPLLGGGLTYAEGKTLCPYGEIKSSWQTDGKSFSIEVSVPVGTTCKLTMPDGTVRELESGNYKFTEKI